MNTITADPKYKLLTGIFITVVTCLVYVQVLGFDFINLDDNAYVYENNLIQQGLTPSTIKWAWLTFDNPYYMPATRMSYLIDSTLFGIDPSAFHAVNLVLHIINSLLVFVILLRMTNRLWPSGFVAILFAIHPQHVETVAWIAQRKELLASFLGLLSLGSYVLYKRRLNLSGASARGQDRSLYLASILFFLLSLLSKPTWIVYPLLLILIDWWPLKLLRGNNPVRLLAEKLPYILIAAAIAVIHVSYASLDADHIINTAARLPVWQRMANVPAIYLVYMTDTFIPAGLSVYRPYPAEMLPPLQIISGSILLLAATLVCLWYRSRRPYLLVGWFWFLIGLSPVVGVFAAGESILVGDRWTYMPHIGFFLALAWLLCSYRYPVGLPRFAATATLFLITGMLSYLSWNLAGYWRDSENYWQRTVNLTDDNHFAHWMLGTHYEDKGRIDQALKHYHRAHELNPGEAYYALGVGDIYYFQKKNPETAWDYYHKLLTTAPANAELLVQMGTVLMYRRELDRAADFFRAATMRTPRNYEELNAISLAHLYLGFLKSAANEWNEARRHFRTFLTGFRREGFSNCDLAYREIKRLGLKWPGQPSFPVLSDFCPNSRSGL